MPYRMESEIAADLRAFCSSIWCYRGNVMTPKWKDVDTSERYLTIIFSVLVS